MIATIKREFEGVTYKKTDIPIIKTKREANAIAKKMRSDGYLVRKTKTREGYTLWVREARPRARKSMHVRMG